MSYEYGENIIFIIVIVSPPAVGIPWPQQQQAVPVEAACRAMFYTSMRTATATLVGLQRRQGTKHLTLAASATPWLGMKNLKSGVRTTFARSRTTVRTRVQHDPAGTRTAARSHCS